jgi:hypothetical protein
MNFCVLLYQILTQIPLCVCSPVSALRRGNPKSRYVCQKSVISRRRIITDIACALPSQFFFFFFFWYLYFAFPGRSVFPDVICTYLNNLVGHWGQKVKQSWQMKQWIDWMPKWICRVVTHVGISRHATLLSAAEVNFYHYRIMAFSKAFVFGVAYACGMF